MARKSFLVYLIMIALLVTGTAFAQSRIARANQAADGQKAIFTVVGNQSAVCLDLAQFDRFGNLLTFSSYYIAPLSTQQIVAPVIAHFKTTAMFAISDTFGPNPSTACGSVPAFFVGDPTREPQIYEALVGGDGPVIRVNQVNAAIGISAAFCSLTQNATNNNTQVQNGNNVGGTLSANGNIFTNANSNIQAQACASLAGTSINQLNVSDVNQVVVFGFEDVPFLPANGAAFTTALANCNAPVLGTAGASFSMTCKFPTGGPFSDQVYH